MTSTETSTRPRRSLDQERPKCPGCPRCQDPQSPTCQIQHPKFANLHPVCKTCQHCVLRGKHQDEAPDLEEHPGFNQTDPRVMQKPSLN